MDKAELRRKAEAKAAVEVAKKRQLRETGSVVAIGPDKGENAYIESPLNSEEMKVVEAYRKWKTGRVREEDDGASAPASAEAASGENMSETKEQRVERLKRKIERRRRVEALKGKLAEKRNAEKPDAIREQALALKERIQNVKASITKFNEGAPADAGVPGAPPAGAMTPPAGAAVPGADGAIPNLPPEITAEIQNIATAAQALASMAGVAPAAPQPGADLGAGIPPEAPGTEGSGMLPEKAQRIARIKALLEKKKSEKGDEKKKDKKAEKEDEKDEKGAKKFPFDKKKEETEGEEDDGDKMIEAARARAIARREALAKIRARAMNEKSYEAEDAATGDVQDFVRNALDTGGAMGGQGANAYGLDADKVVQKAGVKHDGASASMPGKSEATSSISPARVWPAKDLNYGGKVPDTFQRTPDYNPVRKAAGQPHMPGQSDRGEVKQESTNDDWSEKHIDRFIEHKELNFKLLLSQGKLG